MTVRDVGHCQVALDRVGQVHVGLDHVGLDHVGLGVVGLGVVGLDHVGLDHTGLDQVGLVVVRQGHTFVVALWDQFTKLYNGLVVVCIIGFGLKVTGRPGLEKFSFVFALIQSR